MRVVALGLSTALLSLAVAEIQPAQASEVFAFQCLKAGDQEGHCSWEHAETSWWRCDEPCKPSAP